MTVHLAPDVLAVGVR